MGSIYANTARLLNDLFTETAIFCGIVSVSDPAITRRSTETFSAIFRQSFAKFGEVDRTEKSTDQRGNETQRPASEIMKSRRAETGRPSVAKL